MDILSDDLIFRLLGLNLEGSGDLISSFRKNLSREIKGFIDFLFLQKSLARESHCKGKNTRRTVKRILTLRKLI